MHIITHTHTHEDYQNDPLPVIGTVPITSVDVQ